MIKHPEIKHGKIKFAFTPDEETGRGADKFDVKKFGAEYAYTIDGGEIGELEYENFNAAYAAINIVGLKREGFNRQDVSQIKKAYNTMYRSELAIKSVLARLEEIDSDKVKEIIVFILSSKRRVCGRSCF